MYFRIPPTDDSMILEGSGLYFFILQYVLVVFIPWSATHYLYVDCVFDIIFRFGFSNCTKVGNDLLYELIFLYST